jgi:hypothetical protein
MHDGLSNNAIRSIKNCVFCSVNFRNRNVAGGETRKMAGLTTSSKTALPHQTHKSDPHVFLVPAKAAMNKRARIIELNDQLRTTFKGGRVQMTPAVYNLDPQLRGRALWAMARSNKFDDTSNHDWGVMIFAGYVFEWHIEYRAADGTGVSPDPTDPDKTFRVLTLYAVDDLLALERTSHPGLAGALLLRSNL